MTRIVEIFGIRIHAIDMASAVDQILCWLDTSCVECRYVVTPNVDHIVKLDRHAPFRNAYADASLVLVDGRPVVWASRLIGKPLPGVVPGSDLVPALFDAIRDSASKTRVFLLGAAPGVAERARAAIGERWQTLSVADTYSPPLGFESDPVECNRILNRIRDSNVDLLLVGVGAPKQELWVHAHRDRIAAKAVLCIGATIDFLAGVKKRAPLWMQRHGLEWLHRVASEPRRLTSRYVHDAIVFPQLVAGEICATRMPGVARAVGQMRGALGAPARLTGPRQVPRLSGSVTASLGENHADWLLTACESPITRLVQRIDKQFSNQSKRVIYFVGLTKAAGTSSVASAYATAAAALHGHRVLVISVDDSSRDAGADDAMLPRRSLYQAIADQLASQASQTPQTLHSAAGEQRAHALIAGTSFWRLLRDDFDEVVFEGGAPTVSPFGLAVASHVDGVLLVAEAGRTRHNVARNVLHQLRSVKANVLGSVLNKRQQVWQA